MEKQCLDKTRFVVLGTIIISLKPAQGSLGEIYLLPDIRQIVRDTALLLTFAQNELS